MGSMTCESERAGALAYAGGACIAPAAGLAQGYAGRGRSSTAEKGVPTRVISVAAALAALALMLAMAASALPAVAFSWATVLPVGSGIIERLSEQDCWEAAEIACSLDEWGSLPERERIAVLQAIADKEAAALLLPGRPIVASGALPENTWGRCQNGYRIIVNERLLIDEENGWGLANTAAHETYHSFQYAVVNGEYAGEDIPSCYPDSRTADEWGDELSDYQSSGREYWDQEVEASARAYAEDAVSRIREEARVEGGYEAVCEIPDFAEVM